MENLQQGALQALIWWFETTENLWLTFGAIATGMLWLAWLLRGSKLWSLPALVALVALLFQPGLYIVSADLSESIAGQRMQLPAIHLWAFCGSAASTLAMLFLIYRYGGTGWDVFSHTLTRRSALERNQRTDIRAMKKFIPQARRPYSPDRYFRNRRGLFLGLDERNEPVYVPWESWRRSHVDVVGTTGSGKGIAAQVMTTQCALNGEAVVVLDPKGDEYLPHVLYQAALAAKVPYIYIDLAGSVAQWNPLNGKTPTQIQELFSAGFGLGEKGSDADFYRLEDRKASRLLASLPGANATELASLFTELLISYPKLAETAKKFVADLEEIALLPVVATPRGVDLAHSLSSGAIIYVRGSMRNPAVLKLQRIFLVSVMQMVEERDREHARHVCFFLDEFKYLISRPTLELLGAIRDKRAHAILAHQSLGDLRDCPADMDADAVVAAVNENTAIKIAYSVKDPDTADWLSRMSGQILVDDEIREVRTNLGLAEARENGRTLRQAERALIDTNMLQALPDKCAALFGVGLARFFFTSPIIVEKTKEAIQPTVLPERDLPPGMPSELAASSSNGYKASAIGAGMIDVD